MIKVKRPKQLKVQISRGKKKKRFTLNYKTIKIHLSFLFFSSPFRLLAYWSQLAHTFSLPTPFSRSCSLSLPPPPFVHLKFNRLERGVAVSVLSELVGLRPVSLLSTTLTTLIETVIYSPKRSMILIRTFVPSRPCFS